MARYEIHHSCGHVVDHQLFGPVKERERKAEWLEGTLCDKCWQRQQREQRERENAASAATNLEHGLPVLTGSEKQIAWAETLRAKIIDRLSLHQEDARQRGEDLVARNKLTPEQMTRDLSALQGFIDLLCSKDRASWWIDRREASVSYLLQEASREAKEKPASAPASPQEKDIVREAQIEATIRPAGTPNTKTVVEISLRGEVLVVAPPERREDFYSVMTESRMIWNHDQHQWTRKITSRSGPIADRAVEIGVRLLAAGFVVRIHDEALRGRILAGEYEPERTRWVTVCSAKGKDCFALSWHRESNLYALAKRIPGTYWSRTLGSVVAPAEQYEQVMDFAGTHGFAVSQNARALVQTAEASARAALVAPDTLAPIPPEAVQAADTMPPKLEIPGDVQVDPDLRDDE